MPESDTELIKKVEARKNDLICLYAQVYEALRRVDRKEYDASALSHLDNALDPPTTIDSAKAIAVLKAIMGSTSGDKVSMERFYGAPFDSRTSVGEFVRRRVKELGLAYHDFWPFLYATGWAVRVQSP